MMGFGEFMAFAVLVGGIIAVVRTLANAYERRLALREREIELALLNRGGAEAAASGSTVAKLEERVRVLERIATDAEVRQGADVARQIEALREHGVVSLETSNGTPLNITNKETV